MASANSVLVSATNKPTLSLVQIINMSVGFFGIQFGWDLQRANMGPIYEHLHANPERIPLLFLAAPLTGLLVQPVIGYMSDRTWHPKFGRRRPYFLVGAIISSIALIFMPHSPALWVAAGLLWVLDVFGNVAMEPFRAFVADKLDEKQMTQGFVMQSLMIGLGGCIASALPWIMTNIFHLKETAASGIIPDNVKWSFYIGAFFFLAAVLYTVITSNEYPPEDISSKEKAEEKSKGFADGFKEIFESISNMPRRMKVLSLVQVFTWPGLFLMWFYYNTAVARNIFHATSETDPLYGQGTNFGGLTLAYYNIITFLFAFILPSIARKFGRKNTHAFCLFCGAAGLISVAFVEDKYMLFACMTGVGIAWASILSMPYALLGEVLPKNKIGVYMGIFNFFIVMPEIIASLGFGWVMKNVLHNDRLLAVQIGGVLMIVAGIICFAFVKEKNE
jgi:maltose/moltooligosaccharide transporter